LIGSIKEAELIENDKQDLHDDNEPDNWVSNTDWLIVDDRKDLKLSLAK
jgi:hypothetical protein